MNNAEQETAATLAKLHAPNSWPRRILTMALWFGLPFAAMASLGIPIERAAQVAIFPWACATVSLMFVMTCITVMGWCIGSLGLSIADDSLTGRIEYERKRAIRRRDDATTPEASDGWALVLSTLNRIKEPTDV